MATLDQNDISNVEIIIANLASQVKIIKNLWDSSGGAVENATYNFLENYDTDATAASLAENVEEFFEVLRLLINKTNKGAIVTRSAGSNFAILKPDGGGVLGTTLTTGAHAGDYVVTYKTSKKITINAPASQEVEITFNTEHELKTNDKIKITAIASGAVDTASMTYYKLNNMLPSISTGTAATDYTDAAYPVNPTKDDVYIAGNDTKIPSTERNTFGVLSAANTLNSDFGAAPSGTGPDLKYLRNLLLVITDLIFQNIIFAITELDGSDGKGATIGSGTWSTDLRDIASIVSRDQDSDPFVPTGGILSGDGQTIPPSRTLNMEYHLFRVIKSLVQLVGKLNLTNGTHFNTHLTRFLKLDDGGSNISTARSLTGLTTAGNKYPNWADGGYTAFGKDLGVIVLHFFKRVKDLTNELKAYATNNINSTNNTITFDIDGVADGNYYTIPRGKYDAEYFADYLNSRQHALSPGGQNVAPWDFRFAYNEIDNKFAVKNFNTATLTLRKISDASGVLGFDDSDDLDFTTMTKKSDLGAKVNFTIKTKGIDPNTSNEYIGRSSDMVISTTKIAKNSAFITMVHAYQTIGEPLF